MAQIPQLPRFAAQSEISERNMCEKKSKSRKGFAVRSNESTHTRKTSQDYPAPPKTFGALASPIFSLFDE